MARLSIWRARETGAAPQWGAKPGGNLPGGFGMPAVMKKGKREANERAKTLDDD